MCGVAALLGGTNAAGPRGLGPVLSAGMEALVHRGPDGAGRWISGDTSRTAVALGHVRLATFALDSGAQPVANEDGTIVVSCSGELYDYASTRRDLERRGHRFSTDGDAELIVHLYEEFGVGGAAERLRGEFAFVLWDDMRQELMLARDGFGVRPLLFTEPKDPGSPAELLVASEARALMAMGAPVGWNSEALSVACTLQYPLATQTLFEGIRQVLPGEILLKRLGQPVERQRFTSGFAGTQPSRSFQAASAEVAASLEEAVRLRTRAEVPVAALLSGGLDSTMVTALAAKSLPQLPAYTVSFTDDAAYDEGDLAARTAASLGVEHRPLALSTADLWAALPCAVAQSEGLSINHHVAAKYLLMQRLRGDGITVALTGEGADELFFGYAHLRADAGVQGTARRNGASAGLMLPTGAAHGVNLDPIQSALGFIPTWIHAKAGLGARVRSLMRPDFGESLDAHRPIERFAASLPPASELGHDRPSRAASTWSSHALTGYILETLSDRMELAHGVEGRPAFLDQRVAAIARSLPTDHKIRNGREKAVLREAARGLIPEDVRAREKHPFLAPPAAAGASLVLEHLDRPAFRGGGPFCGEAMAKVVRSFTHGSAAERAAWQPAIMLALSYAWLDDGIIRASPPRAAEVSHGAP